MIVVYGDSDATWEAHHYKIADDLAPLDGTDLHPFVIHRIATNHLDLASYAVRFHHTTAIDSWIPASARTKPLYSLLTTPRRQIQVNAAIIELSSEENIPSLLGISNAGTNFVPLSDRSRSTGADALYSIQAFLQSPSGGMYMHVDCYMYDLATRKDFRSSIRTPLRQAEWQDTYTEGHIRLASVDPTFCPRSGSILVTQRREADASMALIKFV